MAAPSVLGVHHFGLTVSDFDRSLRFYTEVLGFEEVQRFSATRVLLRNSAMVLGLNSPWHEISDAEKRFDEARVGLDHLAFRLGSADEVRHAVERLEANGVENSGVKSIGPETVMVVFRDPDNIQLEYFYSP